MLSSSSFTDRSERSNNNKTSSRSKKQQSSSRRASTAPSSDGASRKNKTNTKHHHRASVSPAAPVEEKVKYDGRCVCRVISKETMLRMLMERGISGPSFDLCVERREKAASVGIADDNLSDGALPCLSSSFALIGGQKVSYDLAVVSCE